MLPPGDFLEPLSMTTKEEVMEMFFDCRFGYPEFGSITGFVAS